MKVANGSLLTNDDGFAVVEAIVAFAIVTLSLAVLWQAMAGAYRGVARVKDTEHLLNLAKSQLDMVGADGFIDPGTTSGTYEMGARWLMNSSKVRADGQPTAFQQPLESYWVVLEVRNPDGTLGFQLQTARLGRPRT